MRLEKGHTKILGKGIYFLLEQSSLLMNVTKFILMSMPAHVGLQIYLYGYFFGGLFNEELLDIYYRARSRLKKIFLVLIFPLYFTVYVPWLNVDYCVWYWRYYGAQEKMTLKKLKAEISQEPNLTKYNKFGIIALLLVGGGVIYLYLENFSLIDLLSNVSVWFTLVGVSFFKLYEMMSNICTYSDNFSYKIWKGQKVSFTVADGYNVKAKAMNGIIALFPYTFLLIGSPLLSTFFKTKIESYAVWIIVALYALCCVRTLLAIADTIAITWSVVIAYGIQVIAMVAWLLIVWFLPYAEIQTFMILTVFEFILFLLILTIGITYWVMCNALIAHNKWHLEVWIPKYGGLDQNYFVFEMKNGEVYDSRDKLFYPVIQNNDIRFLFIDGNYLMCSKEDIKFLIVQGMPIKRLWKGVPLEEWMKYRYDPYMIMPMTIKILGEQL